MIEGWWWGEPKYRTNDKGGNTYLSSDVPFHFGVHAAYALRVNTAVVFVRRHTVIQWLIIAQSTNCLGLWTFQKRHARKLVWTQTSKNYFTKYQSWNETGTQDDTTDCAIFHLPIHKRDGFMTQTQNFPSVNLPNTFLKYTLAPVFFTHVIFL